MCVVKDSRCPWVLAAHSPRVVPQEGWRLTLIIHSLFQENDSVWFHINVLFDLIPMLLRRDRCFSMTML